MQKTKMEGCQRWALTWLEGTVARCLSGGTIGKSTLLQVDGTKRCVRLYGGDVIALRKAIETVILNWLRKCEDVLNRKGTFGTLSSGFQGRGSHHEFVTFPISWREA